MNLLTDFQPPHWLVPALAAVNLLMAVVGLPLARRAGRIAAERLRHPEDYASWRERAKDRALFLSALLPTILVWLSVMGVSFRGLTGFATDYMGWNDWTNIFVPLSLDGISVAFGAHAFRAVKRGRYPGRARRIVFAAAATSAVLNYVHATEAWSVWAGIYLAFMSIVGMLMFHEMLDQFSDAEADEQQLRSRTPRFGKRWLLAPVNTFLVWRMWIYDPPADGRPATVRNALDHYAQVQDRRRRRARELADLKAEERRTQIVRNAELARARRAARRAAPLPGADGLAPVTGAMPGPIVDAHAHPAVNGHSRLPIVDSVPAARSSGRSNEPTVTVPRPRSSAAKPADPGAINTRALAARWAPTARRLAAEKLANGERITGPALRDLVMERAAAEDGVAWRPSEGWARNILREVRNDLANSQPTVR